MKTTLTALIFVLASSQVNADGFYQQVANNWQQTDVPGSITESVTETSHTPMYQQVVGTSRQELNRGQVVNRAPSKTTYSPLYQTVAGNPQQANIHRVADKKDNTVNNDS